MPGRIVKVKRYYRFMLKNNPETLYVFGDNYVQRGRGGQAKECRGEPNAVGIPTKWAPSMAESAFFSDEDFDKVKDRIDEGFEMLEAHLRANGEIVWPGDGIGSFLARLPEKAPTIFEYIRKRYVQLLRIQDEQYE